jgi:cellobiose epimerase
MPAFRPTPILGTRLLSSAALLLVAALPGTSAPPAPGVVAIERSVADDYGRRVESELRENILPFWLEHTRDRERGGFYGEITDDLKINRDAPRGALLASRILWTFSAAYRRYQDPTYLEMARWAYDDLLAHHWDKKHGGLFWMVSADGQPVDPRKLVYVQSFGIYGLSEFHRATSERAPLERAIELYRIVEKNARDATHGGYFEEFDRNWKISRARGSGSPMGSGGQKSQNVHLHIMEAYANLLRAWPDANLRHDLRHVIEILRTRMLDSKTHHLGLFFDEDWTPRSNTFSYGHDIEFSWLVVDAVEALGDAALLATVRREAVQVAETTLRQGLDSDAAVLAEGDVSGVTNTFKEWWPQSEAAVGFLNAYHISQRAEFLAASQHTWRFIEARLVDRRHGEWFQGVSREGKRSGAAKVSFWKCPYHNGRACLEIAARLRGRTDRPDPASQR